MVMVFLRRRRVLRVPFRAEPPQSAAYGRMPMATCCRKRRLFSRRLLAAVPSRRLVFRLTGAAPLQCVRIAAGIRPRSPQAERLALPLQASKAFTFLQDDRERAPLIRPTSCLPLEGEGGPLAVDEVILSLFSFKSRSSSPHQALRASFPLRGKPLTMRTPLLFFPKISQCFARCDFREPF